jgi:hypothetical protein
MDVRRRLEAACLTLANVGRLRSRFCRWVAASAVSELLLLLSCCCFPMCVAWDCYAQSCNSFLHYLYTLNVLKHCTHPCWQDPACLSTSKHVHVKLRPASVLASSYIRLRRDCVVQYTPNCQISTSCRKLCRHDHQHQAGWMTQKVAGISMDGCLKNGCVG